jgi:hypothetical protein
VLITIFVSYNKISHVSYKGYLANDIRHGSILRICNFSQNFVYTIGLRKIPRRLYRT